MIRKIVFTLFSLSIFLQVFSSVNEDKSIQRMGNANVLLFDEGWLFMRYGLQADVRLCWNRLDWKKKL